MTRNSMFPKRTSSYPKPNQDTPPSMDSSEFGMAKDAFANSKHDKRASSNPQQTTKTLRSNKPTAYEVGYAKPPKARQYRPGQSGNPFGRPLGSKNKLKVDQDALSLRDIVLAQSDREIPIEERGKTKTISLKEALIRSVFALAAKGDGRALKLALDLVQAAEASKEKERLAFYEAAVDYKLAWERKVEAYREKGLDKIGHEPPRPFPDPDHIIIDPMAGTVQILGPLSRDEIPKYEFLWEEKEKKVKEIGALLMKISACKDEHDSKMLWRKFNAATETLNKLTFLLGDWTPLRKKD